MRGPSRKRKVGGPWVRRRRGVTRRRCFRHTQSLSRSLSTIGGQRVVDISSPSFSSPPSSHEVGRQVGYNSTPRGYQNKSIRNPSSALIDSIKKLLSSLIRQFTAPYPLLGAKMSTNPTTAQTTTTDLSIEVRDLTFAYNYTPDGHVTGDQTLEDIDLILKRGSRCLLIGANGCK